MLGAHQPVAQHFEKSGAADFGRRIQIFWEASHRPFVDFEEQSVFAAEVLEDGTLGDAEGDSDVTDSGRVISMLGEMLGGDFDDASALRL